MVDWSGIIIVHAGRSLPRDILNWVEPKAEKNLGLKVPGFFFIEIDYLLS